MTEAGVLDGSLGVGYEGEGGCFFSTDVHRQGCSEKS